MHVIHTKNAVVFNGLQIHSVRKLVITVQLMERHVYLLQLVLKPTQMEAV